MNQFKNLILFASLFLQLTASASGWDRYNDPSNFENDYEYRYDALPKKAVLPTENMPYSDSYWPRNRGSLNYRWNTPNPTGFGIQSPSRAEVERMSIAELSELSPAEKFDLAQGHYHYPFSSMIANSVANPRAKDYEGVCDGWTATAIQFGEPKPITFKNPDGIMIPIGSSDVKALMSYYVSIHGDLDPVFVGRYCPVPWMGGERCSDINPGAFHVILANEIGMRKRSFASDIDPGKETWNQPILGFEFEEMQESVNTHSARSVKIRAKMLYADDDSDKVKNEHWDPVVGTENMVTDVVEVEYALELDYQGRIVGGYWISGKHPDLFWKPTKKIEFKDDFAFINKIYSGSGQH